MKTITKLLSIILLIMLTQSCSKDSACKNTETNIYYNIADSNKAKIPYTGTDTLVFVSDQGDTATLIGQGKQTYYVKNTRNNSGNADCQWIENKNYEDFKINFKGLDNKIDFIDYMLNSGNNTGLTGFEININNMQKSEYNFEYSSDFLPIEDSIYFNSKYIKGGYINDNKSILYNRQYGILKFTIISKIYIKVK